MELKTINIGAEKFEQLQKSVSDQVSVLSQIKVTDETSLAVANQQLSKTKQITNSIESARKELKEPYFEAGKEIDRLAKNLANPLELGIDAVKAEILTYNKAEQIRKQKVLDEIRIAQEKIEADNRIAQAQENERILKLQIEVSKFESEAFKAIHEALSMEDLSKAYTAFILSFPAEYGDIVKGRIRSLGTARKNTLTPPAGQDIVDIKNAYNQTYATVTGTEVKIEAKIIEAPVEAINFLAQQEKAVTLQSAPTNMRKTWTFEIENLLHIPLEWMKLDEDAVKAFMRENKESLTEGMVYNGIKFNQKETVVIK